MSIGGGLGVVLCDGWERLCVSCLGTPGWAVGLVLGLPMVGGSTSKKPRLIIGGPPSGARGSSSAVWEASTVTDREDREWGVLLSVCGDRVTKTTLRS